MTGAARRWAVVPAAGRGERFGAATPKQYSSVRGRAVRRWSLAPLLAERRSSGIVVALARRRPAIAALPEAATRGCDIASAARDVSCRCAHALECLAERRAATPDWVLVHDAARPVSASR